LGEYLSDYVSELTKNMKGGKNESENFNSFFGGCSGVIIVVQRSEIVMQQSGVQDNSSENTGR